MAELDPALQQLVDNQAINENWPDDYPYHILLDGDREDNGRPVIAKVGEDYFSAWLTRDADGNLSEVTLLDETQLGRVFNGRPGADQDNRVVETGRDIWIDNVTGDKWPENDYEQVFYNTQTGDVVDQLAMFEGNAEWLNNGQNGDRPFNSAVLPNGLAADGVSDTDLEQRLPANVRVMAERRLFQTADSQNKAIAERTLSGDEAFATAQFRDVRGRDLIDTAYAPGQLSEEARAYLLSQSPEATVNYSDRAAAEAAGLQFDTTQAVANDVTIAAAEEVAASALEQQAEGYAALYGEEPESSSAGGGLFNMDDVTARVEERRAEQAAGTRAEPIRIREQQTDAGAALVIPDMPDIPAPETVLINPQQRQQYVDSVLGSFEERITSSSPNSADGMGQMEEALVALREQLPSMIDPERLKSQIQPQLDAMSSEERAAFEANGGVDAAIATLQQDVVTMSASAALNPDLNVAAQDAIDHVRADLPSMAGRAFDSSVARLNESLTDRFQRAESRVEAAEQAVEQAVSNINETQVQTYMEAFRAYRSTPAWEQFREAYSAQGDDNINEALRRLDEEQAQPALPGVNR